MTGTQVLLAVAGGVVVGGLCLCGIGGLIVGKAAAQTETVARERRKHEAVLSDIKQIGFGAIQASVDGDDILPGPSNFRQKIRPYLIKRTDPQWMQTELSSALDHCVWTFPGGSQTAIDAISTTELASIADQGQRAVVYADGHASWVSDASH